MTSAATIILVLYFVQGSLGHAFPKSPIVRVAGGHAVNITDAPYMAALLQVFASSTSYRHFYCGGTIIHKQFVLTSGPCTGVDLIVRVGSSRYGEEGKLHQVEMKIKHESNNVALLKLSEPVTLGPSVNTIKLADDTVNVPVGLTADVTGWGETKGEGYATRDLQQASVTVTPQDDCNNYYLHKITDKEICVKNRATGACYLDEGGPLTVGDHQIGIFLYGNTCGGPMVRSSLEVIPNVYEKVAPYIQWIHDKIKQNL